MSENISTLNELVSAFTFEGELVNTTQLREGHINDTYVFDFNDNGKTNRYLVQVLNTYVFRQPEALMSNVVGVTNHLRKAIIANGGDPERECLTVYPAKSGKPYYIDSTGRFWRCYNFISNAHSCQSVENETVFFNAAKAFGNFQKMLADYPGETLTETIPNFHNTVSRFADFKKALAEVFFYSRNPKKTFPEKSYMSFSVCLAFFVMLCYSIRKFYEVRHRELFGPLGEHGHCKQWGVVNLLQ